MRVHRIRIAALVVAVTVSGTGCVFGAPRDSGEALNVDRRGRALAGHDVVAYFGLEPGRRAVTGSAEYVVRWRGADWWFESAANRDAFAADPERYAPNYGAYCAMAMSQDELAASNPDAWAIHDDELYVFARRRGRDGWLDDPPPHIQRADANWPAHRARLVGD